MSNRRVLSKASSVQRRRERSALESSKMRRKLQLEFLEERQLLAVGPRLVAIEPNVGEPIEREDVLDQAPEQLKFVFDSSDVIDEATVGTGILLFRSGGDDTFGDGNEVPVAPAFAGVGTAPNEVFLRFSETLPDDTYRIEVVGTGAEALRNVDGGAFGDVTDDGVDNGSSFSLEFELQLGAQVISVVPQPITRDPDTGELSQAKNQIHVYFNESDLDPTSASTPAFYRLIDTRDQSLLFPSSVVFDPSEAMATLSFPSDLSTSTYQLQIGASEEANNSIGDATDLGTIAQQATAAVYDSPVVLDLDGNEVPLVIPDGGSVISAISVTDSFFISDVNVEVDIDHEWGPDLRVFLRGPGGQRVELIRDLGSQVRGGQIYGVQYDDLNSNGQRDEGEPGLPGWTIFIDTNDNGVLDPGERSTVTDSEGRYSFVNLDLNQSYELVKVPQAFWQPTSPIGGASFQLYGTDFSDGSVQTLTIVGNATEGTFRLGFSGRSTPPIEFAGPADPATTATNIEEAFESILDPGVGVAVTSVGGNEFELRFVVRGIGTPIDHPALVIVDNQLNAGNLTISNAGDASGYTSDGDNDLWHLSNGRGNNPGHTPEFSFYFGQGETEAGGGEYVNNADATLRSPEIDLTDPAITGPITLRLNHYLAIEESFDFAEIRVVSDGVTTVLLNTDVSTGGFQEVALDLTPFAGQRIQLEFNVQSDFSITEEGWYVDDIRVETERSSQTVTLVDVPQQRVINEVNFGSTQVANVGPDGSGYRAFQVGTTFEDISGNETAQRILQEFTENGSAVQIGGAGDDTVRGMTVDASGNVYLAGSFQGTVDFDLGPGTTELTSSGGNDAFVAKYDSNGALLWARSAGGVSSDVATSVALNSTGDVLVGGSFSQTASFGGTNLTSNGSTDAFIWKLDGGGNTLWARGFGGSAIDEVSDLHVAGNTSIVSTGYFSSTVDFDPGPGTQNLTSAGGTDIFVLALSQAGNFGTVRQIGGTSQDRGEAVHVAGGIVAVTGSFSGTVDFNTGPATNNLTSGGGTDGFVLQLNSQGNYRNAYRFGGTSSDRGLDVTRDEAGGFYVTGISDGDVHVQRISPNGSVAWTRAFGGSSTDVGQSIWATSDGTVFVGGSFRNSIDFGGGQIDSLGGSDGFVLQLDDQGNFRSARTFGGTLDDAVNAALRTRLRKLPGRGHVPRDGGL